MAISDGGSEPVPEGGKQGIKLKSERPPVILPPVASDTHRRLPIFQRLFSGLRRIRQADQKSHRSVS